MLTGKKGLEKKKKIPKVANDYFTKSKILEISLKWFFFS